MSPGPRPRRRPGRAALIGWSAVVWAPVLVVALLLLHVYGAADRAVRDYRDGELVDAVDAFDSLTAVPFESWKAPFGEGTALLADDQPAALALFHLDRALGLVPDEARCDVQTNRAVALTRMADDLHAQAVQHMEWTVELQALAQAGTPAPASPPWGTATLDEVIDAGMTAAEQAAARYGDAADAVQDPSCEDQRDDEEQQDAQERADDLRDQQQESQDLGDRMDPSAPEAGEQDTPASPQEQEQQRQQELQDRNQQAGEDAQPQGPDGSTGGDGDGGGGVPQW
ncbi:MAG TPA: hypothetical protein VGC57_14460 [Cellulomonas sp.]